MKNILLLSIISLLSTSSTFAAESMHKIILAKKDYVYKVNLTKSTFYWKFLDHKLEISAPVVKAKNDEMPDYNSDVQVATIKVSAHYAPGESNEVEDYAEGTANFTFDKPTIVKIVEVAPNDYQLNIDSIALTLKNGVWKSAFDDNFSEFYKK